MVLTVGGALLVSFFLFLFLQFVSSIGSMEVDVEVQLVCVLNI